MNRGSRCMRIATLLLCAGATFAAEPAYDPLAVPTTEKPTVLDLTVVDTGREREVPLRVYLPVERTPAAVLLFSHGLGGSREGNAYLGEHWSARGYVAVFVQHPGSDTSVWQGKPPEQRLAAMQDAAGVRNFLLRAKDIPTVLDQLGRWNVVAGHPLAGRLDLERIGMSGHSFGAVTTQAVSGQRFGLGGPRYTDPRIKAAVALSPSAPRRGDPAGSFGHVKIPWLLMTGTKDVALIGDADVASRLAVFPALPSGGKYELVLQGAEHSAFGDRALPGDTESRNPNHHRAVLALTTAFWDTYLMGREDAKAWLDGDGPRSILQAPDRWQSK